MSPDMVHRNQRHPQPKCHGFCEAEAHQHRADKARRIGDRHRVNILPGAACVRKGLFRQGGDGLHVLAGGDFRHNTAVERMEVRLGRDGVRQHSASVLHHRHGGLIARAFKG